MALNTVSVRTRSQERELEAVAVDWRCLFPTLVFPGMMNFAHGFGFTSEFFLCDKWRLAAWGLVVNLSLWATPLLPGILFVTFCSVGLTKLSGPQRAELLEFTVESSGRKWNCSPPKRKESRQGRRVSVWAQSLLWCFVTLENYEQNFSPLSPKDIQTIDLEGASRLCFAATFARAQFCSSLSWDKVGLTLSSSSEDISGLELWWVMESLGIGSDTQFWRTIKWTKLVFSLKIPHVLALGLNWSQSSLQG